MLSALAFATVLAPIQADVFRSYAPYPKADVAPSRVLGYEIGSRHTTHAKQQQVIEALCKAAPDRTRYLEYGKSTEGRPLRIVTISSPENMARLPEILKNNQALADGKADPAIIKNNPIIVWVNQNIHGDEAASFESGMELIYNLATSQDRTIIDVLKKAVVIVNPCYNPDGHERYVIWQNSIAVGSSDPGAMEHAPPRSVNGRVNHYRFDLNRDKVSFSQVETQQEVAIFNKRMPQVYIDQHGEVETYFFPPTAMSNHALVGRERYLRWTETFGRATAKAFDRQGFGYYIKDIFDMYYPGYLDSFATLNGAIGMTHETDAAEIALEDRDGVKRTLLGGAAKHFTAAMAVILTSVENREALLQSFSDFRASSANGKQAGEKRYLLAFSADNKKIQRLSQNLAFARIDSRTGHGKVDIDGESLWNEPGRFIGEGYWLALDLAQPNGLLAKALCSTEGGFEEEFINEQIRRMEADEGSEFYDMTGWSLPLLHDVKAWWLKSDPNPTRVDRPATRTKTGEIGFAIAPGESGALLAIRLLHAGLRIGFSDKDMTLDGRRFKAGTFMILKGRNEPGFEKTVEKFDVDGVAYPLPTGYPDATRYGPGSENVSRLRKSSIAILFGDDANPTPFGSIWHAMETNFRIPFTPITRNGLRTKLDRFSVILAPGGRIEVSDAMKTWVNEGGCLVLLGGSPSTGGFIDLKSINGKPIPVGVAKAKISESSWLGYGSEDLTLAVPVEGATHYTGKSSAIEVFDSPKNMLHGWAWPDDTEKAISGSAFAHVEGVGNGHVVWFANDPTERAMFQGLNLFLLNAMAYGPRS